MLILILIIATVIYLGLLVILNLGLGKLPDYINTNTPKVSVLIPARDEERNIAPCLEAILAQDYPKDLLEIIVIDDRSTDATAAIVRRYQQTDSRVQLIEAGSNTGGLGPKKNALQSGIRASTGSIVITTDADCTPREKWVSTMISCFDQNVGVVAGPSILTGKDHWLTGWLQLETLGNIAIYASSIGLKFPVGAQGANLAYRFDVWNSLGYGESGKAFAGDDDLFLQRTAQSSKWKIRYALKSAALVPHYHQVTGAGTIRQKRRHLSVVRLYRREIVALAVLVALYHLLLALGLVVGFFSLPIFLAWLACIIAKSLGDWLVLNKVARHLDMTFPWQWLPVAEVLRPWAMLLLVPLSLLGKVSWKGRTRSAIAKAEGA
jgi:cellulose synthase/poly-beta-1,6-N-acetylglucosamine synthase-like glycosyltransferase